MFDIDSMDIFTVRKHLLKCHSQWHNFTDQQQSKVVQAIDFGVDAPTMVRTAAGDLVKLFSDDQLRFLMRNWSYGKIQIFIRYFAFEDEGFRRVANKLAQIQKENEDASEARYANS